MYERIQMTNRTPVPIWNKLNPLWWLVGPDGWTAPTINNGTPYLPGVTNQLLRNFYWFCRNPGMNLVGYVLGVEDKNYTAVGLAPVLLTTWRDASPPARGWKWSVLWTPFSAGAAVVAALAIVGAIWLWWPLAILAAFAALKIAGPLPFVSYSGPVEFYLGWRAYSGGFGLKLVKGSA
jgi:hypothetical protein